MEEIRNYVHSLIATMHVVLAMRMHPLTGETDIAPARVREIVLATFAAIRDAYSTVKEAAEKEDDDVKTKRLASHKEASANFTAQLEAALKVSNPPKWAIAYRDMLATAHPAGGDSSLAKEIKELHDGQRKALEAFAVMHPVLTDWEKAVPKVETKGRPAGSRNAPKVDAPKEVPATS
jgi:hypothetical protein